jgi:hypothetical protein
MLQLLVDDGQQPLRRGGVAGLGGRRSARMDEGPLLLEVFSRGVERQARTLPAMVVLVGGALTPCLDHATPVRNRAGAPGGTSGAPMPIVSAPVLCPANRPGARSDRSATSPRNGSGGDGLVSTADFAFAVSLVDAATGE